MAARLGKHTITREAVYKVMEKTRTGKRHAYFLRLFGVLRSTASVARSVGRTTEAVHQVLSRANYAYFVAFKKLCRVRN